MDELLNGGVQLGRITELSGAPGSGKSQLWYERMNYNYKL